jgi:two-component system CheB/CheR fusion protein
MAPKKEPGKSPESPQPESPAAKGRKTLPRAAAGAPKDPKPTHRARGPQTPTTAAAATPGNNQAGPQLGEKPRFIVGIGASAGGLEAYSQFFAHLPVDTGMAFIIVQHLDPVHESILPELMAKMTRMVVRQVSEGSPIKPNEVYVISPNTDIAVSHGMMKITTRSERRPYLTIDHLFRSLAEDQKDYAIGILLSGTSSDGALGVETIKHAGGITFAQDEASARYSFMPNAAVATGCVDFVLNPGEIARELAKITRPPFWSCYQTPAAELLPERDKELEQILLLLQKVTGVNFTLYKRSTLRRRIMRRMVLHKLENLESYLKFLTETHGEVEALYQDVLIKVTGFFRDEGAFEVLKKTVFPEILAAKPGDAGVRFWVPGCSSGEEAYSLAMSWLEFLGDKAPAAPIQIFATDVSEAVIDKARLGIFLENIASEVSPERLRRFFVKVAGGYQISKTIRDMCVFAWQNLIQDPPFSKLDLISCRNVLIYLQTALQKRVIPMFHSSLNPAGFLMLGTSETVGTFTDLFGLIDKKYKIYRKKSALAHVKLDFLPPRFPREHKPLVKGPIKTEEEAWNKQNLYAEADRLILSRFAPARVLINEDLDILQFRGQTGPYLEPAPGEATFKLMRMAREGLLLALRTAVNQAMRKNEAVKTQGLRVDYNGTTRSVDLEVIPLKPGPTKERFYLVLFEEALPKASPPSLHEPAAVEAPGKKVGIKDQLISRLREELAALKEHLQAVITDKEAADEKLRAANEEILSANEEFQSVNEELEIAKEELQSANEELTSLNEKLHVRNTELTQLNNDYNNLLLSSNIPIIMLGRDLRIRHITHQAHELFNLIPGDVGRPITDIKLNVEIPGLEEKAKEVIDTLLVKTQDVQDRQGHWYRLSIRPYYTMDKKIEGAVITLMDIDELKQNLLRLNQSQNLINGVLGAMGEALLVLDRDLHIKMANQAFYKTFQLSPEETIGIHLCEIGKRQWNIPELKQLLQDILAKDAYFQNYLFEFDFPGVGPLTLLLNGSRLSQAEIAASEELILLTMTNISELQKARESLKEAEIAKRLTTRLLASQDMKCPVLAWELRDVLERDLGTLDKNLREAVHKLSDPEEKTSCEEALAHIKKITASVSQFSWYLPPAIFKDLGITAALKNLLTEFRRYFKIEVDWDIDELDQVFTGESRNLIYRVLEEALFNIGRHSGATRAEVAIKKKGDQVSFVVKDNGKGFNLNQVGRNTKAGKKGKGLPAMVEQLQKLGGILKIWSKEGKGTHVTFTLPVKKG